MQGRIVTFEIPYPKTKAQKIRWNKEYGLNAIYEGKHWTKRKRDSEFWHWTVKNELIRQGIEKNIFENPVVIEFSYNDNLDCSNHAYIAKMVEDSLKNWVICDDNRKYVKEIRHKFYDGDSILVQVREQLPS